MPDITPSNITIDAHIDVPWKFVKFGPFNLHIDHGGGGSFPLDTDYPRMKTGGLDAAFFALYLSDQMQDRLGDHRSYQAVQAQIDWLARQDSTVIVQTPEFACVCLERSFHPIFLGLEGGRLIHENLENLREYARKGVRYLTLTHNKNTSWADSATDTPHLRGLSEFGREVVRECENLGVLVDVSHASDYVFWAVANIARKPFIATHSACRKLCEHPRNLTNTQIRELARRGGVIHIPFASRFLGDHSVTDHIQHVVDLVGPEFVGIGSDLDGALLQPGIRGVQDWAEIVSYPLIRRGFSSGDIRLIRGGNTARLFQMGPTDSTGSTEGRS